MTPAFLRQGYFILKLSPLMIADQMAELRSKPLHFTAVLSYYSSCFFSMNQLLSVNWSYWERADGFPTRCVYVCLRVCLYMYICILWDSFFFGKTRAFLVTLGDTSAHVPLAWTSQGACIQHKTQHCNLSCLCNWNMIGWDEIKNTC